MAAGVSKASFEPLRSIASAGISGSYAAVGDPLEHMVRSFCVTNNTQGNVIISTDNTISDGEMFVLAGSYKLYDVQSNMNTNFDDKYVLPIGSQFYIKQSSATVSGSVYIECLY